MWETWETTEVKQELNLYHNKKVINLNSLISLNNYWCGKECYFSFGGWLWIQQAYYPPPHEASRLQIQIIINKKNQSKGIFFKLMFFCFVNSNKTNLMILNAFSSIVMFFFLFYKTSFKIFKNCFIGIYI